MMKITDLELICLKYFYKPEERYAWAGAHAYGVQALVVKVETDNGVTGLGEVAVDTTPEMVRPIVEFFKERIIGHSADDIESVWNRLYKSCFSWGRRGLPISVIGAIDTALWDIKGKNLGVPVYELLGGKREARIKAYASGGEEQPLDQLANEMKGYASKGFRAVKIRIGYPEFKRNLEIVRTAREALGDDIELMVDAGQCYAPNPWSMRETIKIGRMLEEYDVAWFEEPWLTDDLVGYAFLAANLDVPISGGEASWTRWDFATIIEQRAMDIIQPDVSIAGGISECRKIATLAQAHSIEMINHTWTSGVGFPATLHFAAATPNVPMVEYAQVSNPILRDLMVEQPTFSNGYLELPKVPGLGVDLTDEVISKYSAGRGVLYEYYKDKK